MVDFVLFFFNPMITVQHPHTCENRYKQIYDREKSHQRDGQSSAIHGFRISPAELSCPGFSQVITGRGFKKFTSKKIAVQTDRNHETDPEKIEGKNQQIEENGFPGK